jgi:alpha-D-ribose 1-methylphosphonate 5-triphosphate synthase subunit PhnG
MGILARIPGAELEAALDRLNNRPRYDLLRGPEIGLAMVRGRAGGDGQRFNLGEMTLTRCSLRLAEGGIVGHGYVTGRDRHRAELAAFCDALMQAPDFHDRLETALIAPAERAQREAKARVEADVATSKVDFFTMVRGDSA